MDPHGDDGPLFAAYTLLKERPDVIITHPTVPEHEIKEAYAYLECNVFYWPYSTRPIDRVIAPAPHPDGHEEHNAAGEIAAMMGAPVTYYSTYAPRAVRQTGELVEPEPWMVARKLRALSCFESQIENTSTRPWFTYLLDMREWISEN